MALAAGFLIVVFASVWAYEYERNRQQEGGKKSVNHNLERMITQR
jgi:hypothetical protein